jgi:hypothetical protein
VLIDSALVALPLLAYLIRFDGTCRHLIGIRSFW